MRVGRLAAPKMKSEAVVLTKEHGDIANRERSDQPFADGLEHMVQVGFRAQLAGELDQRPPVIVTIFVEDVAIELLLDPVPDRLKYERRNQDERDIALILVSTFVFQPIRNWIQEQFDRYIFYKDRYDYRRTLVEFARELSSETDLDHMLESVGDRLIRTLSIRFVAVFLREEERFRLHLWSGKPAHPNPDYLDLSFLGVEPETPYVFFERTRLPIDVISREMPASVRHTIADLDLTYYIPCMARGRTIAYLAVSRTEKGDFLSSDDLELLVTLSGYVAIAIENSRLYSSLQQKVEEYERLKEFSENIVESINVGIMAVDLHDRVESWNSRSKKLTGIPRHIALGRSLRQLFPIEMADRFDEVKGQTGIHNIYKVAYRPLLLGR